MISPRMVRVKPRTCLGRRGFRRDARRTAKRTQLWSVGTGKSANRCAKAMAHKRRLTVERQWFLTWVSMNSATVSASAGNHLQDLARHQSMKHCKSAAYPFMVRGEYAPSAVRNKSKRSVAISYFCGIICDQAPILAHYTPMQAVLSMISGAQIRAARALLGLTAAELARISGIGHRTLQRFEATDGIPDGRTAMMMQLIKALETQGISFQGDPVDSPGVQLFRVSNVGTKKSNPSQS